MEIDRRSDLSLRAFEKEYVAKSRPVILTDQSARWPARTKWNLDYFASHYADKELRFDQRTWRLGDFIAAIKDGSHNASYLKEVKLDEQFPELWQDVGSHHLASNNRLRKKLLPPKMRIDKGIVALFIGTAGGGFKELHWDYSYLHVFISQIYGDKDAILFAPSDTPYVYPRPEFNNKSQLRDPFDVDLEQFPEFKNAKPIHVTVREGETLFLPGGWWHATKMNHPSISIAESTLDHYNWKLRRNWFLDHQKRGNTPKLRQMMTIAYMTVADKLLQLSEFANYWEVL